MEPGFFIGLIAVAIALCGGLAWIAFFTPVELLAAALGETSFKTTEDDKETNYRDHSPRTADTKQSAADQSVAVQVHQTTMNSNAPERQYEQREERQYHAEPKQPPDKVKWTEKALVVVTSVYVVAAIAQAIIAGLAIRAAMISADAATESVRVSQSGQKIQLRAYIAVQNAGLTYDEKTNSFSGVVTVDNTGQTPAHYVSGSACVKFEVPGYKGTFELCAIDPKSGFSLGSRVPQVFQGFLALQPNEVAQFKASQKVGWLVGQVRYQDVFGKEHFTNFRFYQSQAMKSGTADVVISFDTIGNDSD